MTSKEFENAMKEISERETEYRCTDKEVNHMAADNLMCELLEKLGYYDGVKIFRKMPKWYA